MGIEEIGAEICMGRIRLLDCTLRDGGYVNDWKFGYDNLISVFERLVDSNVDIIEVGFLDDRRPFDIDRSIMPDTKSVERIWGKSYKKQAMVVGMIDYGTCDISNIAPCKESYLDGIRVIFKEHLMYEAMEYCKQIKNLGYKVFSQLVSVTTYTKESMMELIDLANEVKPYAVSMVDTYGLLKPDTLLEYYKILEENLCKEICIGFHAHNNLQLAYANSLFFLSKKDVKHDLVVDGTLYGMGKSAGNAPIELLAMSLNENGENKYNIGTMLEAIEESIMDFFYTNPWGYKLFFYLCALNKCHPNYLSYYQNKDNLSVSKLNQILAQINPIDKKLLYDESLAKELYGAFIADKCCDVEDLKNFQKEILNKTILLVGPGKNIGLQIEKVKHFIETENPYIISINYLPEAIKVDCVFSTNVRRYKQLITDLNKEKNRNVKILATSNIEGRGKNFEFQVNCAPLLEKNQKIKDNSLLMLIKLLVSIGVEQIFCAGFDGYSEKEDNYLNPEMEYYFVKKEAINLNSHMKEAIYEYRKKIDIQFLTYSIYDQIENVNSATY